MKDLQVDTSEQKAVTERFYQPSWQDTWCFAKTVLTTKYKSLFQILIVQWANIRATISFRCMGPT